MSAIRYLCWFALFTSELYGTNPIYDAAIDRVVTEPVPEHVLELGGHLRGIARHDFSHLESSYYVKVQSTLLSIPGHARYFAEEIRREQKEVAQYPTNTGPRISYDRNRSKYFITLTHLPSPETIAVLGEFLSDDIDTPRLRISPHSDWGENPRANSFASTNALSLIGLRDPPATKDSYDADPDAHLAKSRAWWEEVKTGERTFSFKGQAVEYRFKPDGTWDTIPIANPPDDGPQATQETTAARPVKRLVAGRVDTPETPAGHAWWRYAIGGAVLLAAGAWFMRKKDVG